MCYYESMKITIIAHPKSKKPRIEKDLFGNLNIYISEPPLEGRANMAVLLALSDHLKIKRSQIKLIRGEKSKIKVFEVVG